MNSILLSLYIISGIALCVYLLYYFLPIALHEKKNMQTADAVSVIICAKNEAANLKRSIPPLLAQKHSEFEILIIDDHSDDDSLLQLKRIASENKRLRVIPFTGIKKTRGKKEALAFGIANAKYDTLLLTDADCQPLSENWISEMTAGIDQDHQLNIGISLLTTSRKSFFSWFVKLDAIWVACNYIGWALRGSPYMMVGRNVCYTKTLYESSGRFDAHLHISSGDDDLFAQTVRYSTQTNCIIHPESQTTSAAKSTWKEWLRQKGRHHSTGIAYPKSTLLILGLHQFFILSFYFSFFALFFTGVPLLLILALFFLKNILYWGVFRRIFSKIGVNVHLLPFVIFELIWTVAVTMVNFYNLFRSSKNGGTWS